MASGGLGSGVRLAYKSCGQISREPGRIFEWKQGNEKAPPTRVDRRSCIFVLHNATGEKLPLHPSLTCTLGLMKEEVSKLVMIPASHIRLSWRGHVLEDTRTLVSYGITNGHCIHFSCCRSVTTETDGQPSPRRLMPLTICMVDDSDRPMLARLRVLARIYDKVLDVKLLLEAQTGIDAGDMRLTMGGRSLPNENTLIECGVRDESAVLHLICVFGMQDMTSVALQRNAQLAMTGAGIESLEFLVTVNEVWPAGRRRRVGLTTDSTIRSLKEQLAVRSGIQPEKQMLLHRGRVLVDDLTASYYNLDGGTHLDLAVVGGMQPTKTTALRSGSCSQNKRRTVSVSQVSNAGQTNENCPSPRTKQSRMKMDRKEIEVLAQDAAGDEARNLLSPESKTKSNSGLAEVGVMGSNDAPCVPEVKGELNAPQLGSVDFSETELCVAVSLEPIETQAPTINLASELDVIGVCDESSDMAMKYAPDMEHPIHELQSQMELNSDPSMPPELFAPKVTLESTETIVAQQYLQTNEVGQVSSSQEDTKSIEAKDDVINPLSLGATVVEISLKASPTEGNDLREPNLANATQMDTVSKFEVELKSEGLTTESILHATPLSINVEVEAKSPNDESVAPSNTARSSAQPLQGTASIGTTQDEVVTAESEVVAPLSLRTNLVEDRPTNCESSMNALEDDVASQSSTEVVGMALGYVEDVLNHRSLEKVSE